MLQDNRKSRGQLIEDLQEARRQIAKLEAAERDRTSNEDEVLGLTLRSIGDAVIATDRDGCVSFMNLAAEEMTGWEQPEATGTPLAEVFDILREESGDRAENPVKRVFEEGVGVELADRTHLRKRGGGELPIAASGAPIKDDGGAIIGTVLVFRDITDHKRAGDRLRILRDLSLQLGATVRLEETLAIVLAATIEATSLDSGGIYLIDGQSGKLNLVCSIGLSPDFVEATSQYSGDSPSARLATDGQPVFVDYSNLTVPMDETRCREGLRAIAIIPVHYQSIPVACLNVASHSHPSVAAADRAMLETLASQVGSFIVRAQEEERRKKAEVALRASETQLHHSRKMEAIGRLAGGVAHDFNNVLCAITGNADLALIKMSARDPMRMTLEEISKAAKRAADLTRQLLAFSRKQIIESKVIDLSHLIESLHEMLVRLIGEDITLRTVPQQGLGRVRVDPGQVEQIVLNLAINARDAMPDGGELLIETADVLLANASCEKHAKATPSAHVMLAVSDDGCGMSAEIRERIFEPFFTTKQLGRGTGLGLATVFGIVEQNGGRIEVYSEPGEGSTFKIYFPRVAAKAEALSPSCVPEPLGGKETVLVVEDEESVRSTAVELLLHLGYKVKATSSGSDAIVLAGRDEGRIDLLLTDVVMPQMNGRELARRLVEMRPGLKVLYTSGYTQNVIAHHGVLDAGVQFIAKPYSLDTLAVRVREVLDIE